jgi:hypothetical protein
MFIKRGSPNRSRRAPFGATAFSLALHLKKKVQCRQGILLFIYLPQKPKYRRPSRTATPFREGPQFKLKSVLSPPFPPVQQPGPLPEQGGCGPAYLCTSTGGVCQAFARTALFLAPPSSLSRRLLPGRQCEGQLLYRPMAGCPFP